MHKYLIILLLLLSKLVADEAGLEWSYQINKVTVTEEGYPIVEGKVIVYFKDENSAFWFPEFILDCVFHKNRGRFLLDTSGDFKKIRAKFDRNTYTMPFKYDGSTENKDMIDNGIENYDLSFTGFNPEKKYTDKGIEFMSFHSEATKKEYVNIRIQFREPVYTIKEVKKNIKRMDDEKKESEEDK